MVAQNRISQCMTFAPLSTGGSYAVAISEENTPFKSAASEGDGYGLTKAPAFVNRDVVTRTTVVAHNNLQPYVNVYFWQRIA